MHIIYAGQFNLLVNVIYVLLLLARSSTSLNCYVCGFDEHLNCTNFNNFNRDLFAQKCPPDSRGCITQTEGEKIITMGCDDFHLNDCQLANGIEYCYCNTNLCNGNTSIKKSITHNPSLNDDEDLSEGSGLFTSTNSQIFSTSTSTPQPTTTPSQNTGGCIRSTYIFIIVAIFCFL
ncbi:hypothetical protein PPYR_05358 [Photinus pyralis]|uniref:Protein sleepless n=2 Tax=Photinus pyralis TaxID=7054 RepID=A0A5N4AUI8_PHOPY|nr:hypothetical protein PPYR_05358 [Photinus pyralis]